MGRRVASLLLMDWWVDGRIMDTCRGLGDIGSTIWIGVNGLGIRLGTCLRYQEVTWFVDAYAAVLAFGEKVLGGWLWIII
jgi:hypothetical protein